MAAVLDASYVHWNELKSFVASRFDPVTEEWGFSSSKTGWGLRLKAEKRAILYLIPCKSFFLASFALGEKAVLSARLSDLPDSILSVIDTAKKYAEGRGVRLEVRSWVDVINVEKLAVIKMAN